MTKAELMEFLEGFTDDIQILIYNDTIGAPIPAKAKYFIARIEQVTELENNNFKGISLGDVFVVIS